MISKFQLVSAPKQWLHFFIGSFYSQEEVFEAKKKNLPRVFQNEKNAIYQIFGTLLGVWRKHFHSFQYNIIQMIFSPEFQLEPHTV